MQVQFDQSRLYAFINRDPFIDLDGAFFVQVTYTRQKADILLKQRARPVALYRAILFKFFKFLYIFDCLFNVSYMIKDGYSSVSLLSFSCYFIFQLCNLFCSCYLILFCFTICCHITHIMHIYIFRKNNCLNKESALNLKVFVPQEPMQIIPQFSVFSSVKSGHNWIIIDFSSSFVPLFPRKNQRETFNNCN